MAPTALPIASLRATEARRRRIASTLAAVALRVSISHLIDYRRLDRGMGSERGFLVNDDVLLKFLNKGLINVGGDDAKLGHLRQTAVDLTDTLQETPAKAGPYALVAFDPHVPTTDPTLAEVKDALRRRWETYVNTFADTPVAVFRAMLLDALIRACGKNEMVAAAFVASARNVLPYTEVGEEREIWADIVGEIEKRVEERSEREWATPSSISLPEIRLKSASSSGVRISSKKVNTTSLGEKLMAAAGPDYNSPDQGHEDTQGNQHWPQDDSASWLYEFGTRTGEAVGEAINRAIGDLSVEGVALPEFAQDITQLISEHVTTTLQAVSSATGGLQRRTSLLWWKEALFSPSSRMSYREMSACDAAAMMAFDMHGQIPTFSPASVAAFLRETVMALPTIDREQKFAIRELVEKTRDASTVEELRREAGRLVTAPAGRTSILGLIGYPEVVAGIDDQRFRDLIGVKPDTMLTLPDWSVWIFRELQAARAITEASAPKRRT